MVASGSGSNVSLKRARAKKGSVRKHDDLATVRTVGMVILATCGIFTDDESEHLYDNIAPLPGEHENLIRKGVAARNLSFTRGWNRSTLEGAIRALLPHVFAYFDSLSVQIDGKSPWVLCYKKRTSLVVSDDAATGQTAYDAVRSSGRPWADRVLYIACRSEVPGDILNEWKSLTRFKLKGKAREYPSSPLAMLKSIKPLPILSSDEDDSDDALLALEPSATLAALKGKGKACAAATLSVRSATPSTRHGTPTDLGSSTDDEYLLSSNADASGGSNGSGGDSDVASSDADTEVEARSLRPRKIQKTRHRPADLDTPRVHARAQHAPYVPDDIVDLTLEDGVPEDVWTPIADPLFTPSSPAVAVADAPTDPTASGDDATLSTDSDLWLDDPWVEDRSKKYQF
ncbi:hypothetical protein K474DRAFT_1005919 [Panus rudis PR-1116 ss-1]|nr:hypothetical protein K474DRAFT_1005919 [Panus rudis PR-1116 ss-1]